MERRFFLRLVVPTLLAVPLACRSPAPRQDPGSAVCKFFLSVRDPRKTDPQQSLIRDALRDAQRVIEADAACAAWLCAERIRTHLEELLKRGYYGHGEFQTLSPQTPRPDIVAIANSGCTDLPPGFALTLNRQSGFFREGFRVGGVSSATPEARRFIILHELAHLIRVPNENCAGGFAPDAGDIRAVEANNRLLKQRCSIALKSPTPRR